MAAGFDIKPALTAAVLFVAAVRAAAAQFQSSTTPADEAAIRRTLSSYEAALNASDAASISPLYSDDGVFMAPGHPSAVGKAAVQRAYDGGSKTITIHLKFNVAEIVQMSPEWAFARTSSAGTITVNAIGATTAEAGQELFVFKKGTDGAWNIARYSFSSTNPPPTD